MLIKLLSDSDKKHLIELAKLLAISDKPLLWDGKTAEEFTSDTDLNNLTIQNGELENELIKDLEQSIDTSASLSRGGIFSASLANMVLASTSSVESRLIEVLKTFPIIKAESPETRVQAATTILRELLKGHKTERPSAPKVMLFELILVALRDGHISSIELTVLKEFQLHYQLDDFIFDDLLERAEALNQEISKTISIILE